MQSDPSFGFALSNLSGDKRLPPLGRIADSFSEMLASSEKVTTAGSDVTFHEIYDDVSLLSADFEIDGEELSDEILDPVRLVELALHRQSTEHKGLPVEVDVVIPVFSGYRETMRCIASVLLAYQRRSFSIIVVDDCTPDTRIAKALDILSNAGLIELRRNSKNSGFVVSCNLAAELHPERDIILLNSDTEVYGDWIDRLLNHAEITADAGTITPFSNNATICSYPDFPKDNLVPEGMNTSILDRIASSVNKAVRLIEIPTGVGFCMYIKRACIGKFGLFNYSAFGFGYGEENDFARRIINLGYKNYLAPNIYVYHAGGTSFASTSERRKENAMLTLRAMHPSYEKVIADHIELDPARNSRARIDIERLRQMVASSTGVILHVSHNLGGGTEKHVRELCQFSAAEGKICLIARPLDEHGGRFAINHFGDCTFPNLPTFSCFERADDFLAFSAHIGLNHLHIHHLLGYGHLAPDYFRDVASHVTTDFTIHDYFPICARINLIDGTGKYCGGPGLDKCEACVTKFGSHVPPYITANDWRNSNLKLLEDVRRVFVPSMDCGIRLASYIRLDSVLLRKHPMVMESAMVRSENCSPADFDRASNRLRRVLVIGAITDAKGASVIASVASSAKALCLPINFHIIGYLHNADQFAGLENVFITGMYAPNELPSLIELLNADFMWIPSIWPETFCYALMEGICAGLMPVSFDIGAQAERIREIGWGMTVPLDLQDKPRDLAMILNSVIVDHSSKITLTDLSFLGFDRYYDI